MLEVGDSVMVTNANSSWYGEHLQLIAIEYGGTKFFRSCRWVHGEPGRIWFADFEVVRLCK